MDNITADTTHEDAKNLMDRILAGIQHAKNIQSSRHTPEETKDILSNIIKTGENIMDEIQAAIISGKYELIDAGGKFLAALASTIDVMGKFHQLDQKTQADKEKQDKGLIAQKELQELRHQLKLKELEKAEELRLRGGKDQNTTNNTVIIATREEILEKLMHKAEKVIQEQIPKPKKAKVKLIENASK